MVVSNLFDLNRWIIMIDVNRNQPMVIVTALKNSSDHSERKVAKMMLSSMVRSLFSGEIIVFRDEEAPLFKVERARIREILVSRPSSNQHYENIEDLNRKLLFEVSELIEPGPRQWVIIADASGLCLRNIDHLIPPDLEGNYAPAPVDFYCHSLEFNTGRVSRGLWAVRGEYLGLVMKRWRLALELDGSADTVDLVSIWSELVKGLPIKKKYFEKGEIYAPENPFINWDSIDSTAFVTLQGWPVKQRQKLLQALYLEVVLGDESGMMIDILEV